jgi:hypothetical protein
MAWIIVGGRRAWRASCYGSWHVTTGSRSEAAGSLSRKQRAPAADHRVERRRFRRNDWLQQSRVPAMTESVHATPSDALVFFGITGDLAFKQIFPALQALIRRTRLDVPIIGIARSASSHEQLCSRAHASLEAHGGVDAEAFGKLCARLRYIAGDYGDAATYERLRAALGAARRPLHYLAIPPSLFVTVVDGLARSGCAQRDRPREGVGRKRFADRHVGQVAAHRSYGKALQIEARIGSVGDRRDPGTMSAQGQIVVPCWVRLTSSRIRTPPTAWCRVATCKTLRRLSGSPSKRFGRSSSRFTPKRTRIGKRN